MRRREFILLWGGFATAPFAVQSQQRVPTVGYINSRSLQADAPLVSAFRRGLRETGYVEGKNVAIEFRWVEGDYARHEAMTADLVRRQVDVIVATSAPTAIAAKKVPRGAIPLVFTSGQDPVKDGLVAGIDRPGGDTTGIYVFTVDLGPKRLQILRELVPGAALVGLLLNPNVASAEFQRKEIQAAASVMGQRIEIFNASSEREINLAFDIMARSRIGALLVGADPFFQVRRPQLIDLAQRYRIPAMYEWAEFVTSGGLASYSTNRAEAYRLAGKYAGRILKGEKPADLPVLLSTKFELVINLKTAKALNLSIPQSILLRADEVIE